MRPDVRQLTFVSYHVIHPPLPRMAGNELAEFYSLVHGIYPFESCFHRADSGGVIETEGWAEIDISREGFRYEERVRDDYNLVRKRAVDVFDLAKTHYELPVYIVSRVTMRQLWPCPDEGNMSQRLRSKALSLSDDAYEPLGDNVGAGIHLVGTREEPMMHWHLELDPYGAEDTTLWTELRAHFAEPYETIEGLGASLDTAREFLEDNVTKFILGFMEDEGDAEKA